MSAEQHDDLLERATAALRDETTAEHAWPSLTRARLLESAARGSLSRRRRWLRWLLSTGSVFVVGTALARVPDYAPRLIEALRPALVAREASADRGRTVHARKRALPDSAQAAAAAAASGASAGAAAPGASAGAAAFGTREGAAALGTREGAAALGTREGAAALGAPEGAAALGAASDASAELPSRDADRAAAGAAVPAAPEAPQPAPAPRALRRVPAEPRPQAKAGARTRSLGQPAAVRGDESQVPVDPPPSAAPPIASAELELFRRAESLHRASDPRALEAWDAYLRLAQHGVLVPEARYNRALCLVRLGRKAEAQAALTPFARGVYGSYRRREAEALLKALGPSL